MRSQVFNVRPVDGKYGPANLIAGSMGLKNLDEKILEHKNFGIGELDQGLVRKMADQKVEKPLFTTFAL